MHKISISILTVLLSTIPWFLHEGHKDIRFAPDELRVWAMVGIFINLMMLINTYRNYGNNFDKIAPFASCLILTGIPGACLTNNESSFIWCLFSVIPGALFLFFTAISKKFEEKV